MNWEMNGVGIEPEELFELLKHFAPPLGIIIFGADSALKADIYRVFRRHLDKPLAFERKGIDGRTSQIRLFYHEDRPVLICLHGNQSLAFGCQSVAKRLRALGAHTLVGVYVKVSRCDPINFRAIDIEAGFDHRTYYRQIKELNDNLPPSNLFHHFVIVENSNYETDIEIY